MMDRIRGAWEVLRGRAFAEPYDSEIDYDELSDFGLDGFVKKNWRTEIGGISKDGKVFWKNNHL